MADAPQTAFPATECCICTEALTATAEDLSTTRCGHSFHTHCLLKWNSRSNQRAPACPLCRHPLEEGLPLYSIHTPRENSFSVDGDSHMYDEWGHHEHGNAGGGIRTGNWGPRARPAQTLRMGDRTAASTQTSPTGALYLQIQTDSDAGLRKSLPPPSCFEELLEAYDPIVVVSTPTATSPQQIPFFQGTCPWIHAEPGDAYSVAEAIAIQMHQYEGSTPLPERRCTHGRTAVQAGSPVVALEGGRMSHYSCWSQSRQPSERPV